MDDGVLDDLADLVDALVLLPGRLAQFAVGGFLCGVIIPPPMYPLSAIRAQARATSSGSMIEGSARPAGQSVGATLRRSSGTVQYSSERPVEDMLRVASRRG